MINFKNSQHVLHGIHIHAIKYALIAILMILPVPSVHATSYNNSGINNGSIWANSTIEYTANVNRDGSILFTGCDEGQDLAFRLTPKQGTSNEYLITKDIPEDCENPFPDFSKAKYVNNGEFILICLYDYQGRLGDVLSILGEQDAMREADWVKTCQLLGEYTSRKGEPLIIDGREVMQFSGVHIPYNKIVFNSLITNLIEIKGNTRLKGFWEVEIIPEGLKLRKVTSDDEYFMSYDYTGDEEVFTWARKDIPRFKYASEVLLNGDQLRGIDNKTLRLMRNEIFFHHGYVPASKDLKNYLIGKEWYTPSPSNDQVFKELSLVETLNVDLIKTTETLNEVMSNNQNELTKQVDNVYSYIEIVRRYYMETPPEMVEDGKWESVDDLFCTRSWRDLRRQVDAIDRECECSGFLDFSDNGPLDAWRYDCFEGKIVPEDITIYLFNDGTANIDFKIKDVTTIYPVPMSWMMRYEDGEWRVDNIIFKKDGYVDLRDIMEEYVRDNGNGKSAFNFEKYRQQMEDQAEANLNWRKSLDDIKLISYAIIDIDNDGNPEVWVRDDGGQDFQGVFAISPNGDVNLIECSDARSELRFFPGAVSCYGYYGNGEFRESAQTVKGSQLAEYCNKRVLTDDLSEEMEVIEEEYCVNGKSVTETQYEAFYKRLGQPYEPEVQWIPCP